MVGPWPDGLGVVTFPDGSRVLGYGQRHITVGIAVGATGRCIFRRGRRRVSTRVERGSPGRTSGCLATRGARRLCCARPIAVRVTDSE